jgi:hypothetical protein
MDQGQSTSDNCGHSASGHLHNGSCCSSVPNPGLCQKLDEMDFERGIWQAALDDDTQRIRNLIIDRSVHPDSPDNYG